MNFCDWSLQTIPAKESFFLNPCGGSHRVTEGEEDHATAAEETRNALSNREDTHGGTWIDWPRTEVRLMEEFYRWPMLRHGEKRHQIRSDGIILE